MMNPIAAEEAREKEKKITIKLKDPNRFALQQVQQQKDRLSERWTIQHLIDEIYLLLMGVKRQFCMMEGLTKEVRASDPINYGRGVIRRIYEEQARYKMYRMVIYRPPPSFIIHLKDLDEKVKRELAKCDKQTKDDVLKQAVERIFEAVDNRYFLLSAKPYLNVRMEK